MAKSSVIGALRVNLGLDSASFQRGITKAQNGVERFAGNVSKRLGALGNVPGIRALQGALAGVGAGLGVALGAGAAAGVAALGALSLSAVNAADEIRNMSAIANATPQEFQGWAAGAKSVGIEQDKLADILKDMNDRVGDFMATGGGPMVDFFERIGPKVGVTADDFRKLSGPQALQLYVSSLEKANVNQQDFTFFMEAIASDSTALVPLLRNGGAAMQAYAARAEALGAVMSDKTVKALAGMKQSFRDVGTVMVGVRNQLGAAFAPILQSLADTFVSLMTKGSGVRLIFDGLVSVIGTVARFVADLVTIISGLVSWLWNLGRSALAAADEFAGVSDAIRFLIDNSPIGWIYQLVTGFADLIRAQGGFGAAMSALGDLAQLVWQGIVTSAGAIGPGLAAVWGKVKQEFFLMVRDLQRGWATFLYGMSSGASWAGMDGVASGLSKAGDHALGGADQAALSAADAFQEYRANAAAAAAVVTDAFGPARAKLAELTATTDDAAASLGNGGGGSGGEGLSKAADKAGSAAKKAADKLTPLQEVMKALREEGAKLKATLWMNETDAAIWDNQTKAGVGASSGAGQQIATMTRMNEGMKSLKAATDDWKSSMSSAFSSFVTQGGSFSDVLSNILGKLADMVASAGFDAIWSGSGLGKSAGGFLSFLGIGKNAEGTRNWRGGLTRVNERGGEIMNLPGGTQIIPNDISKRMADRASAGGGGGHMSIGFDPTMGAFTGTLRDLMGNEIAKAKPEIVGASVGQVRSLSSKSKSFLNR